MTVDWNHFTPWSSLAGGAVIGLATLLLVLVLVLVLGNGRSPASRGSWAVLCKPCWEVRACAMTPCSGCFWRDCLLVVAMLAGMTIHDRFKSKT
ncbi:MAG: hypothetical protein M3150_03725 [Pseudomonadota bacterium]|nr:hypothetical protein [Pseudomonadota bacterium]